MRRVPFVLAALVVVVGSSTIGRGDATAPAKLFPCVLPEEGRDYVPPSSPDDRLRNGATGVTNAFAVRVSKLKSYTAARFVGGEADGKIGTWGAHRVSARHNPSAWALDRDARRYDIQGVDTPTRKIAEKEGLRASDPAAKKARQCVLATFGKE